MQKHFTTASPRTHTAPRAPLRTHAAPRAPLRTHAAPRAPLRTSAGCQAALLWTFYQLRTVILILAPRAPFLSILLHGVDETGLHFPRIKWIWVPLFHFSGMDRSGSTIVLGWMELGPTFISILLGWMVLGPTFISILLGWMELGSTFPSILLDKIELVTTFLSILLGWMELSPTLW